MEEKKIKDMIRNTALAALPTVIFLCSAIAFSVIRIMLGLFSDITFSLIRETVMEILFLWWYMRLVPVKKKDKGFVRVHGMLLSISSAAILSGIVFLYSLLMKECFPVIYTDYISIVPAERSFPLFAYMCVIVPITEEFMFRGISYTYLKRVYSPYVSIIISSLLFGAYHFNIYQALYSFIVGVVLGILAERYDGVFFPIVCHAAFNIIQFFLMGVV